MSRSDYELLTLTVDN